MHQSGNPANKPKLAPEYLRRKFWEVADPASFLGYPTPFEKIRRAHSASEDTIAHGMKVGVDAYLDMEQGFTSASADSIADFCKLLRCSPLDLYQESPGETRPLPHEIFHSMKQMIEQADPKAPYVKALGARLLLEYTRAEDAIRANLPQLKPLLLALGYAPDLKSFEAPLFTPAPDNIPLKEASFAAFMDQGGSGQRATMENCLNAYQLLLEIDAADHQAITDSLRQKGDRSYRVMAGAATEIFGPGSVPDVRERVFIMLLHNPDVVGFKEAFVENPAVIGLPLQSGYNVKDKRAAQTLLAAAGMMVKLYGAVGKGGAKAMADEAAKRLTQFQAWRNAPKTQELLDWFEHWKIFHDMRAQVSPKQAAGFPLAGPNI